MGKFFNGFDRYVEYNKDLKKNLQLVKYIIKKYSLTNNIVYLSSYLVSNILNNISDFFMNIRYGIHIANAKYLEQFLAFIGNYCK